MEIREQRHGAVTVLRPVGPLLQAEVDGFRAHLERALTASLGRFVLDASGIPFVDSAGLEALADAGQSVGDSGQVLKLCGANDTVREVLDLTGLTSMFDHYEDVESATRSYL